MPQAYRQLLRQLTMPESGLSLCHALPYATKTPRRALRQDAGRFCYLTGGRTRAIRSGAGWLGRRSPSAVLEPAGLPGRHRSAMENSHTQHQAKAYVLLQLSGWFLLRIAQRRFSALLFQAPP